VTSRPVGSLRVVWILARVSLRRWANRVAFMRAKRAKKGARTATARKSGRSTPLLLLFGLLMLFNGFNISYRLTTTVSAAVSESGEHAFEAEPWPEPGHRPAYLALFGLVLSMLVLSLVFTGVGSGNTELSQVGWSLEWLFSFPVPTRGLFLARIGEYTLTNAFAWLTVFPLLCTLLFVAGQGALALPLGLLSTLSINAMVASVRFWLETFLRKTLSLHRLKNMQAAFTVAGLLTLFATFYLAMGRQMPPALVGLARRLGDLALVWPATLPLLLTRWPAMIVPVLAAGALFAYAAVALSGRLVSAGLLSGGGGPYEGKRHRPAPAADGRPPRLRGLLGKELLLLGRDRNFMMQTLLMPLLVLGFQVMVNPSLGRGGMSPQAASATAFGVGAYVLLFGAFSVLAVERQSLWLLWTLPRPLHILLRQKVILWASVALVYAGAVLAAGWRPAGDATVAMLLSPPAALLGVALFAWIASGLGVLGTDPFEEAPQRRVRQEYVWIYMMLVGLFGVSVYAGDVWPKFVMLVLMGLLAGAIWQRVGARLPLLLDPTEEPPSRIDLAYGLVVVILFFQFQQLVALPFLASGRTAAFTMMLSYGISGGIVCVGTCIHLRWRMRLPQPLHSVGVRGPGSALASLPAGFALGLCAAALGGLYLWAGQRVEPLRSLLHEALRMQQAAGITEDWRYAVLAVVLAPLFEEFIFRGLVFRGLRQTMGVSGAVLVSALVFAVVHPVASFVPVFGLGVAAALAYERTGWLLSPLLAHATYNAAVLLLGAKLLE